jgi:hypothetical protein
MHSTPEFARNWSNKYCALNTSYARLLDYAGPDIDYNLLKIRQPPFTLTFRSFEPLCVGVYTPTLVTGVFGFLFAFRNCVTAQLTLNVFS